MNTAARATAPQLQISPFWRVGVALAVLCLVALAWGSAGQASRERVQTTQAELSRPVTRVTLPRVEVVVRREAARRSI